MATENIENKTKSSNPFPVMEKEVLNFWEKAKIFEKSVANPPTSPHFSPSKGEGDARKDYVFYDGPPFATGEPHYGHLTGSIMKDAVPRYWTMNGYRVERKWGWDCHGLPIENIVEKELGITHKKEIEEMGVEKFNEFCRTKVLSYVDVWKKIINRLGRWADMENPYKTMDIEFMESVWWVFKQLWDKGLIYESYRSMHICPRCETTLSQSEVSEGYKDIKDLSATVKFELIDEPGTYVLAWTTTPWTLIGNVALAVGNDINYVKAVVKKDGQEIGIYITEAKYSKEIFSKFFKESGEEVSWSEDLIKGSNLVGKKYKPLFDYYAKDEGLKNRENGLPTGQAGWQIYPGDFVTTEEGTGVVHIAPAFGEDDMNLGKKYNLPFIQHVGMDGIIKPEVIDFAGLSVKPIDDHMKTDVEIIKYLAAKNLLFHKEKYEHSYPHCWRCETPLLNYATSSYFVKITKLKESAIRAAKNINWSPEYIKEGRFGNWLEGARDWSISRQRYWASVIPLWKCDCGEIKVVGSVAELKELSGQEITDLHKHVVDKVIWPCAKCGGIMKRIPDVLDTWFDSGSMPYAQMHYPFENKEKFEKNFPAEFIAEGIDQTRCWFYYLHVLAIAIRGHEAFKNVIVNGIVLAEDGKKMAKRLKNYPDPSFIFDNYSADAMRFYLLSSHVMLAENLNFSENGVKDVLRGVCITLWNVYKFYEMYATEKTDNRKQITENRNILDNWIITRLNQLITEVTENMNAYNLPKATRPILEFINDFSTWYLRRSRDRFKGDDEADKQNALATTGFVLTELSKVMAPFTPFIAEQIWQKVTGNDFNDENKSVHLESWPKSDNRHQTIDIRIIKEMAIVRKIVELGLAERDKAGIKVRQPLASLKFSISNFQFSKDAFIDLIKDEVNVKKIGYINEGELLTVGLDTALTDALKLEGTKRDIVRQINMMRKDMGLTINDKVSLSWQSDSQIIKDVFIKLGDEIKKDTLTEEINNFIDSADENKKEIKINGEAVKLEINKVQL